MKKAGKKYNFRSSKEILEQVSCRAADRAESYNYRKKYDPPVLSVEALTNMQSKLNKFETSDTSTKIWEDRGSRIAIPYGSELYLNNERGIESVMLGSTRNYFDDLSNPEHEPNARPKFPYDQDAHNSANKIKRLFFRNLRLKNKAAKIIQRNTKKYMLKLALIEQTRHINELVSKVQKKFAYSKKRLRDNRLLREEAAVIKADALKIQQNEMLMKVLAQEKEDKFEKGILALTRLAKAFIHLRRRTRGRRRRETIAVRRIQSWWRFMHFRFKVRRVRDARVYVIYRWRKYYRRKYGPAAQVMQKLYRRNRIKLVTRYIQRMMKGALGRRAFLRKKLEVLAIERARNSRECVAVTRKLRNMSSDMGWVEDEKQVPPIAIADHMRRLDIYSLAVLDANALQYDNDFACLHPAEYECENEELIGNVTRMDSCPTDSLSKRIVIAILNIFVNRPGECLDHTSLRMCREYLKPISRSPFTEEAWNNLLKYPMVNVASLCQVLEPTSATLKKIKVSGRSKYLPAEIIAKAVLVYRWTVHYEWATKQAVIGFRVQHKPRRVCPKCQYPMTFDGELRDHRVCFNNGSYMAWMSKDLDSCRHALFDYCCDPKRKFKVPEMKRDFTGDKVKLSNSDLAATKAKHENYRTAQSKDFDENVDSGSTAGKGSGSGATTITKKTSAAKPASKSKTKKKKL